MWSGLAQRSDLTADILNWQQRATSGHMRRSTLKLSATELAKLGNKKDPAGCWGTSKFVAREQQNRGLWSQKC